jgi:aryl-alcohol dehydrogenase-like predicted oxidoreductase
MSHDGYYTLGHSGLKVSRLALGAMTFGTDWGWGADKTGARQMFDTYLDSGGNFFDTADIYTNGVSETWLGEFIADTRRRDRTVIATKFTYNAEPGNPNAGGNGRKNILRAVEGSLRRLRTDYLDLYLLHTWDRLTPAEEVMRTFDDLVGSGKVRHVGLSDIPAWYASRAQTLAEVRGTESLIALQLEYSLIERNIELEFVPLACAHGMGIMVWSPLGSGLLSGKYRPSKDGFQGEGRVALLANSANPGFAKLHDERNLPILKELEAVAQELDRSMAQVAINWVANRPGVATVLVGSSKIEQLRDNLQALDFTIPAELRERLDGVSRPNRIFPYSFFGNTQQSAITGGATVGDKPQGYYSPVRIAGPAPKLTE